MNDQNSIEKLIDKLRTGELAPGSNEGLDAIRQITLANPRDLATKLYTLPNDILARGMKRAGLSEDEIEELLEDKDSSAEEPQNPFFGPKEPKPEPRRPSSGPNEPKPEPRRERSPFEYDPAAELRRGPRPF